MHDILCVGHVNDNGIRTSLDKTRTEIGDFHIHQFVSIL